MEKNITKKLLAVLMIITILATDFFVLGSNLITYATQINSETSNSNVEFSVYFKEGTVKHDSIEKSIKNKDVKLYAEIKIKNEGYFNGAIEIGDSNFKIITTNIGKIEGNKVKLNQINAGEVIEVELGIEPVIEKEITSDMLSKTSAVKLTGTYVYSKAEKGETIQAEKTVCINYQPDESAEVELKTDIITNKVLSVNGENKRIVQLLVKTRLTENQYPVKQTTLDVEIPELGSKKPEKIDVLVVGELATNGNTTIGTDEWSNENGNLKINLRNEIDSNNKINWNKNVYDELVVTYIYEEDVDASKVEVKVDSEIKLYNTTNTYTGTYTKGIENQEPNNVLIGRTEITTPEMYKGQIYVKADALYNTETKLIITNAGTIDSVVIDEGADVFETSENEIAANTKYISTEINKEKMLEILGQDGKIEIKNGTTTVINKDSEVNKNGNIVINYEKGTADLHIATSKPEKAGVLEIIHTKAITANTYTREQLQTVKTIKAKSSILGTREVEKETQKVVENSTEAKLELKETITRAELTVDRENLSTTVTNENVILGVKLITDGVEYDLYKNPTIRIQLPESVESISVNSTDRLYADEFGKPIANYEKDTKTVAITLKGEQTEYPESSATQLYLQLNLNITLSKIEPAHKDKITMTYSNENATQYYGGTTDVGIVTKQIQISSPSGLVKMFNLKSNENISTAETITQLVSSEQAGKDVSFETALINNTGADISNIRIIGKLPTTGNTVAEQENTFETTLKNVIAPNATIYYTENVEATEDVAKTSNGWTTNIAELANAKLYLIKLENLSSAGNYTATVDVAIPSSIPENVLSYTDYRVVYDTEYETDVEDSSRAIALMTSLVAGLETKLTAQVGGDTLSNGSKVKAGEVIKYTVEVTNSSTAILENVGLKAGVPEGTVVVEPIQGPYTIGEGEIIEEGAYVYINNSYYEEKGDIQEISETISLNPGETYTKQYEVRVKKDITTGTEISNKAIITYGDSKVETDEIKNILEEANVRVTIKRAVDTSIQLIAGKEMSYIIYVENLSSEKINNLGVNIISENLNIVSLQDEENNFKYGENITNIVIDEIPANGIYRIKISGIINKESKILDTFITVTNNSYKYRSNRLVEMLPYTNVDISITSPQDNAYLEEGDSVEYNIIVENTGNISGEVTVRDVISEYLKVKAVYMNKKLIKQTSDKTDEATYLDSIQNGIAESINLNVGEKMELDIISEVFYSAGDEDIVITNTAEAEFMGVDIATAQVKHILKDRGVYQLSGLVWLDENSDKKIDDKELILKDITLKLYDTSINNYATDKDGYIIQTITNNYGEYTFSNVKKGSYIVIVECNTEKYVPTTNSTIKLQNLIVNGETITVVGTEIISIQDNVTDINIGLKEKDVSVPGEQPDNPNDPDSPEEPVNPELPIDTKSISGLAWIDIDRDGQKDVNEKGLSEIKVRIYDVSTKNYLKDINGNIIETKTDKNGKYTFNNIEKGTYIILFEYNTEKYEPTIYMAQGVDTTENSKAVLKEININGEDKVLAVTDIIKLQEDVTNINIGLKEKIIFDLELDKYISRIVVQNSKGTKVYDYKNGTFEKVEIHRKQVQGSLVVLEYTIKIKNNGEITGYAKNIVDYIPSGLTFSSELNTDWYLSGSNLYTKGLENVEIAPGEEKEVKLILTKTMTNENVGLINNRAEIYQDYNTYGESDIDSTPNNQVQSEDDFGSVDVIIGVSTGGSTAAYFVLLMINMVLIGIAIRLMIKNKIIKISTKKGRR